VKIGILGTGDVGKALGNGFIKYGHDVTMGSREAGNAKAVAWAAAAGAKAKAATFAGAVPGADVVVLATLWTGTESALDMAGGPAAFAGKVVIDATNPLDFSQGAPRLSIGHTDSAGEQVQRWLPGAKVVKAFNMIGNAHMVNPQFPGGPPDMFICGNDDSAKKVVADICQAFGLPVTDFGGIQMSRVLEPLCILWVAYGIKTGGWNHAFKMLRM
jgi:hypothetical protein